MVTQGQGFGVSSSKILIRLVNLTVIVLHSIMIHYRRYIRWKVYSLEIGASKILYHIVHEKLCNKKLRTTR